MFDSFSDTLPFCKLKNLRVVNLDAVIIFFVCVLLQKIKIFKKISCKSKLFYIDFLDQPVNCLTRKDIACIFPFKQNGVTYTKCSLAAWGLTAGPG
jgi:hypothetical protein